MSFLASVRARGDETTATGRAAAAPASRPSCWPLARHVRCVSGSTAACVVCSADVALTGLPLFRWPGVDWGDRRRPTGVGRRAWPRPAPRSVAGGQQSIRPPARSPTYSAAGRPRCAPPTSLPRCTRPGARPRSSTGSRPSRTHTADPQQRRPARYPRHALPARQRGHPHLRLAARRTRQAWLARSLDARRRRRDSRRVACLRARARSSTHMRGVAKRAPQTGRIGDHPPPRQLERRARRSPRPRRSHSSKRPPRAPMR